MKKYERPELEFIQFDEDVILTSEGGCEGELPPEEL